MTAEFALLINYLIICLAIVICDLKWRIIPDVLTIPGTLFAFIINSTDTNLVGFEQSGIGYIVGGLSILLAGMLCFLISRKDALGGGDLKLLAMIGAFWGWKVALTTFAIAPFAGAIYAMTFNKTRLPYGIFLIGASWMSLLIG